MQMMLMMVTNQISSADKPTNLKDSATKPINLKDSAASDSQWRDYEKKTHYCYELYADGSDVGSNGGAKQAQRRMAPRGFVFCKQVEL